MISMAELVFLDVETTAAVGRDRRFWVVEFGSIVVCPRKLVEVESFCTLIRPPDISVVARTRMSGITRDDVASAPTFAHVADRVFQILNGRVWAGHNIHRFDCHRIREAFADIGRPPPEPIGVIDSLEVLAQEFGRRAGDLKMATLASYFGLGKQKHRSLDDVRMNLEVLKHCATVLLLESSLPHIMPGKDQGCLTMVTRSKANNARPYEEDSTRKPSPRYQQSSRTPCKRGKFGKVMEGAKEALRSAEESKPLSSLLRHSSLLAIILWKQVRWRFREAMLPPPKNPHI